jgi:hypothetical protein
MKKFIIAAVLSAAAVSPSLAASGHYRHAAQTYRTHATADWRAAAYAYAMAPIYVVIQGGQVLGADPDPFIRGELIREGNPADFAGN